MQARTISLRSGFRPAAFAALLSTFVAGTAFGQVAPALQRSAAMIGQQQASAPVSGTVWLQLRNKAALDAAVQAMYTPGSPTYHKFADAEALKQFAPTAQDMAAVRKELAAHNLSVVSTDANNFSVKIQGQTSDFNAAFHTTVNQYRMKSGTMIKALATAPSLGSSAAGMVRAVTGISGAGLHPYNRVPVNPSTGKQIGLVPAGAQNPQGAVFASDCLYQPANVTLATPGAALPIAVYGGLVYGAPVTNTVRGTISPCGYSPQDVYKLTGLDTIYQQGYTGKGQTIAIVDAYGSPTIQADLASFNTTYKLTPANSTNFKVIQTVPFTKTDAGWAGETTLDVEWSHAIAPDANIVLITTPSNSDDDLQSGVLYAILNHTANVISNSYGGGELTSDLQTLTSWDEICELGAFEGISVNFATGDDGDFYDKEGVTDVSSPADSPFATAIGGTSTAFSPFDKTQVLQNGWGTNITQLGGPTGPSVPPVPFGFYGGSGGGESQVFRRPSYQVALGGTGRQLPDVSALADPYTGVEILFTIDGARYFEVIGGTSLSTPIFSAEWALLDQRFGFPLGQAAPYIAAVANTSDITDVMPPTEQFNVQGGILSTNGLATYSAASLAQPETSAGFASALYNDGIGNEYDLTFGTDSSLPVLEGWDPVTGYGTLNMPAIFKALAGK